jgi:hypothetical protein
MMLGCGEAETRVAVTGKITVDGESLQRGAIIFKPNSKEVGPQAATTIENGSYHFDRENGPGLGGYDVLIYAEQPLDFNIDEPGEFFRRDELDVPANVIPAKYNTRTTLEIVTQANDNEFDFALTTNGNQP